MSTLAEDEPERAIRNAMERLRRRAEGTPIEEDVRAESAIVDTALAAMSVRESSDLMHPNGRCRCAGEGSCEWCVRMELLESDGAG
jgi:hypothetical protein